MATDWNFLITVFWGVIGLGIIAFYIWNTLRYNIRVTIKEITANKKRVIEDRARQYIDHNGQLWWRLKKERDKTKKYMPIPPDESIEITKRGKLWHETYRTQIGEYVPIIDTGKIAEMPAEFKKQLATMPNHIAQEQDSAKKALLFQDYKNKLIKEWMKDNNIASPLKPFNSTQRAVYVSSIKKAEDRKQKDWKQDLPVYMAIGSMGFVIVIALIFLPDLINAVKGMTAQHAQLIKDLEEQRHNDVMEEMEKQKEITQNIQEIKTRLTNIEKNVPS